MTNSLTMKKYVGSIILMFWTVMPSFAASDLSKLEEALRNRSIYVE